MVCIYNDVKIAAFASYLLVANRHSCVAEYLHKKTSESSLCKIEKILMEVTEALEQNPGYQLVCCGHSLGGALSTLFACSAAASSDPLIPKPVLCISYASPRVGNGNFKEAYQVRNEQTKTRIIFPSNLTYRFPSRLSNRTARLFAFG